MEAPGAGGASVKEVSRGGRDHLTLLESAAAAECQASFIFKP